MTLDPELAPNTAPSLVALAEEGYFDDTIFHRVVLSSSRARPDPSKRRPRLFDGRRPSVGRGVHERRGRDGEVRRRGSRTAGSQFFVVTGADAGLPPEYAIVGEVTEGMDTVERIDALGVGDGPPPAGRRQRASRSPELMGKSPRSSSPRARRHGSAAPSSSCSRACSSSSARPRWTSSSSREHTSWSSSSIIRRHASSPAESGSGPGPRSVVAWRRWEAMSRQAVVVLADGPNLSPQAVERVLDDWRCHGRVVAASRRRSEPSLVIEREDWAEIPDEAPRATGAAHPVRRPRLTRRHRQTGGSGEVSKPWRRAREARRSLAARPGGIRSIALVFT